MARRKIFLAAAALAAVCCVCTLLCHRIYTSAGQVQIQRVRENGLSAVLYLPESSRVQNPAPGILIVGEKPLSRRALGSELSRRGYVVITANRRQAQTALHYMEQDPRVRALRMAVVGKGEDILNLQTQTGDINAAVGLGFDALPLDTDEYNCLLFADDAPSVQELAQFLRCEESKAEIGRIRGYFVGETARCLCTTGSRPTFRDEAVQSRLFDWLGSSLGHRIELPDDQQLWPAMETLTFFALLSGGLSICLFLCLLGKNTHHQLFRED